METRFSYNPNTCEKSLELHATKKEWGKITTFHLERNKKLQEAIQKERDHKQYMRNASKSMIDQWDNSFENLTKRKEEARAEFKEKLKEERMQRFYEMRREQAAIKETFLKDIEKRIYVSRGYPKDINSAFITSEVEYEREKQRELAQFLKKHEQELIAQEKAKIMEKAVDEIQENNEKIKKVREKNVAFHDYYKAEIKRKADEVKRKREATIQLEMSDIENAQKEMEKMQCMQFQETQEYHKKIKRDFKKQLEERKNRELESVQQEKEVDQILSILDTAAHKLDCRRKAKELELLKANEARNMAAAKTVVAERTAKAGIEDELLKGQEIELRKRECHRLRKEEDYQAYLLEERKHIRDHFLEQQSKLKLKNKEMNKWEIANRYKVTEQTKKVNAKKALEEKKIHQKYQKELLKQIEEKEVLKQEEIENDRKEAEMAKKLVEEEDKKFFSFAAEVYKDAKSRGRNTIPIEHVVENYKKNNLLVFPSAEKNFCEKYISPRNE